MVALGLIALGVSILDYSESISDKLINRYIKCDKLGEKGSKKALCVLNPRRDLNKELEIKKKSLNDLSRV